MKNQLLNIKTLIDRLEFLGSEIQTMNSTEKKEALERISEVYCILQRALDSIADYLDVSTGNYH
ncbi:MAG TPA: hypothetical protein PK926_07015 [Spirochaetota bacterium]|nr:hypothetical protein [Spirochaetota bacterium]HPI91233.1 hypothetical protein [Spirochaetota bacterium]HPR50090.1 hypothetical protein [Spirochaetota bacterium]